MKKTKVEGARGNSCRVHDASSHVQDEIYLLPLQLYMYSVYKDPPCKARPLKNTVAMRFLMHGSDYQGLTSSSSSASSSYSLGNFSFSAPLNRLSSLILFSFATSSASSSLADLKPVLIHRRIPGHHQPTILAFLHPVLGTKLLVYTHSAHNKDKAHALSSPAHTRYICSMP